MTEWIGVDLDGTLAMGFGSGITTIGPPVPKMVERVHGWIAGGVEVRIVTARVAPDQPQRDIQEWMIKRWLLFVGLPQLEVVAHKDLEMIELWDDRAVQVMRNTGMRVDGKQ